MDKEGNIWAGEFTARDYRKLVKVDSKTNKVTKYLPPNTDDKLNGAPRRVKSIRKDTSGARIISAAT